MVVALACAARASAAGPGVRIPVERYVLPNGLVVVLHEDHHVPEVAVCVAYRVGSRDERKGRTGFAHLFEHLMFMGTRAVPSGELDRLIEAAGGDNNAQTSEDHTDYTDSGPSNLLERFLYLEADRMATLADGITDEQLALQVDVVRNERRESYDNRPYGKLELALPGLLFGDGHPYQHPVIGSHEDLAAARVGDVKAFFREHYLPANAVLVVAGDFRSGEARRMIARHFARLAARPRPAREPVAAAEPAPARSVTIGGGVQLERVAIALHSAAAFAPGDAETELLAAVLATGLSSRLERALVREGRVASEVAAEQRPLAADGVLLVEATAAPGRRAAEVERALGAELDRLGREPPTEAELARARRLVAVEWLRKLERAPGRAELLADFELALGDAGLLEAQLLGRFAAVTTADVARQARRLAAAPRVVVRVIPGAGE